LEGAEPKKRETLKTTAVRLNKVPRCAMKNPPGEGFTTTGGYVKEHTGCSHLGRLGLITDKNVPEE